MLDRLRWSAKSRDEYAQAAATMLVFAEVEAMVHGLDQPWCAIPRLRLIRAGLSSFSSTAVVDRFTAPTLPAWLDSRRLHALLDKNAIMLPRIASGIQP